jgi:hypothetical protein
MMIESFYSGKFAKQSLFVKAPNLVYHHFSLPARNLNSNFARIKRFYLACNWGCNHSWRIFVIGVI